MHTSILLLSVVVIWGVNWTLMKITMLQITPLWFGTVRMAIATICFFIFLILKGQFIFPSLRDKYHILIIGCLQMGAYILLINLGLHYNSVGHSVILVYSTPLWITPVAVFFFKEQFSPLKKIGFLFSILGIMVLFNPFSFDWTNQSVLLGCGFLLLAAVIWAFVALFIRFSHWQSSVIDLLPWQLFTGTLFLLISALIFEPEPDIQWTPSLIILSLYIGSISTAFAFWGVIEINKRLPVITSSIALLAVPLIGILTSSIYLKEPVTPTLILAYFFMTSGIVCGLLADRTTSFSRE